MRVLILCDHYPLSPRVKKVRDSLQRLYPGCEVAIFAWNRSNSMVKEDYVISFDQDLGYGNKGKKLFNMVAFIRAASKHLKKYKPDYIHAIDIEMLITAALISKRQKLIYEVYDIKFLKNRIFNTIREKIEVFLLKRSVQKMILASPYFDHYYRATGITDIEKVTINNKPSNRSVSDSTSNFMKRNDIRVSQNNLIIGFIGTIRYKDILINLIQACKTFDNIIILLAGDGPSAEDMKRFISENDLESKVIMTGRYDTSDLRAIYEACDYVWAVYPNKNLNVKYAISNKFFESIVFNKKVIVAERTLLGESVEELNLGYTVNPYDVDQIVALLGSLSKGDQNQNQVVFDGKLFWEDDESELLKVYS